MDKRPNVVFVLTDDQGYGDLECTGNPIIKTPNINRLYEESAHFTNFHVGPTCAPSRAGLMTGHYANSTGVWHTIGGRSLLRKNECTLASALKNAGYKTGIFGKWHLGDNYPYRPMDRGFEKSIVHGGGGISQTPDYWGNDYFDDTYFINGKPHKFNGYCTDVFFREAKKFMLECKNEPFFCYIATNAPHGPFNVENKYADKYRPFTNEKRARFYGMIDNIDENVGSVREFLKENGLYENTVFIFMTDNGTGCGVDQKNGFVCDGYNCGMRGKKGSPYDGGHRVPFFMHYPNGGITHKKDYNEVTANVDFMPTILDLCKANEDNKLKFHGQSLKPILNGDSTGFKDRIIVTDSQRICTPVKWRQSAVCSADWRLVNGEELYDIKNDIEQRNDVSYKYPQVVKELRTAYDKWWEAVSANIMDPLPLSIRKEPIVFNGMDIINPDSYVAWNQQLVRQGLICSGYYEVDVEEAGEYTIELRRWTRETDTPLSSEIDPNKDINFKKDCINPEDWTNYSGSHAIKIASASLKIQNKAYSSVVKPDDKCIKFDVKLDKGLTTLEALFIGQNVKEIFSPYFVYINPKD